MGVYLPIKDYSATQGPAPDGFHVPSKDEWVSLCGILTSTFGQISRAYTLANLLKMPVAGCRNWSSASVNSVNSYSYYWSSSRSNGSSAYTLYAGDGSLNPQNGVYRANGFSVRCFKNIPVEPDSNWTILYQGSGSAGVYHNQTLGLISVSGDGNTWTTIMDKNLGATDVYNIGASLTQSNCGGYFQWGNNYMFPFSGGVTTSGSQVDASTYGPGNYYSSSTFITGNQRWDTTDNGNLWGGVTGVKPMSELKNAYIGEVRVPGANTFGYRPLNGNANDLSGNGNNGTASNITWDSGGDGGCAYFNGNAYIDIPSLENTTTRTFSFWVKCASNASGDFLFTGDNSDKNLTLIASSGKINTQIWKSGIGSPTRGITNNYSTATVGDGTWHHIVVTINSNVYTTYIDGVQDNSYTWSYGTTPISVIRMGMHKNGSSDKYTGYIDTLIIEKVCWTADEVTAYYNQIKPNYGL